jgi:hypothetical protein
MNRINADIVDNAPILSTNIIHKIDRAQFVREQSELHAFKDIVINNFILPDEKTIFNQLIESAEVSFVCYSLNHIGELLLEQKLAFREPYVFKSVLERIELPAGPEQILELIRNDATLLKEMQWRGPPILVKTEDGQLVVINGNHRLIKITQQSNTNDPFYCLQFNSIKAYEEFTGLTLNKIKYENKI